MTGTRAALDELVEHVCTSLGQVPSPRDLYLVYEMDYEVDVLREVVAMGEAGPESVTDPTNRNPFPIVVCDLMPTCGESVLLLERLAGIRGLAYWIAWEADVPTHLVDRFEVLDADVVLAKRDR